MHSEVKVLMFTDQVNSTRQTQQRTGAEIQQVTRVHQELTAEVLRQCRGTLLKDTGNGVLAMFPSCADAAHCGALRQQRVTAWNEAQSNDRFPSLPCPTRLKPWMPSIWPRTVSRFSPRQWPSNWYST